MHVLKLNACLLLFTNGISQKLSQVYFLHKLKWWGLHVMKCLYRQYSNQAKFIKKCANMSRAVENYRLIYFNISVLFKTILVKS